MAQLSLFEQWMFEAPGDDPNVAPDSTPDAPATEAPPDTSADNAPPDIGEDAPADDGPPDISDDSFDDGGLEDAPPEEDAAKNMNLSDKVSSILSAGLYQNYLELISQIGSQMASIKSNSDILYALTDDMEAIVNSLRKLDENIRLYIDTFYINKRYEENLLFYNKCKNLSRLINDKFDQAIHKGIKEV